MADDLQDQNDFQGMNDLQDTGDACSQVIPLLKTSNPDLVDCYSVYAAQQGILRHISIKRHPYDLAFALTDFKLAPGTNTAKAYPFSLQAPQDAMDDTSGLLRSRFARTLYVRVEVATIRPGRNR